MEYILKMKKIIYKMRNMMKNKNDEDEIDFIELTFIHKMKIFIKLFFQEKLFFYKSLLLQKNRFPLQ